MAIVNSLKHVSLERNTKHSETECSYSIVTEATGEKFLQLDTYGSAERQIAGKKSQSIRFSPAGIRQLRKVLDAHFTF